MKYLIGLALGLITIPNILMAQDHPHYTMFMYNKLIYNPGYAGNKNMMSVNAAYRQQWTGIDGAPRNYSVAVDAPVGSYMKEFRPVALGLSLSNESAGVTDNTSIMAYYSYRIRLAKSVMSFGVQAGAALYSANFTQLSAAQAGDAALMGNINNAFLPNIGAGVFWSGERFYAGVSVPNLIENYYDKDSRALTNNRHARQMRSYYASGGYTIPITDQFSLQPQVMVRYAGNDKFQQPVNADFNMSFIFFNRLLLGATYRTDKTIDGIVHLQVTKRLNLGYAYGYATSQLQRFNNGTHEVVLGFDFVRDLNKYANPRFIRPF